MDGIDGLDVDDPVAAEQMRALFGCGLHPLAELRLQHLEGPVEDSLRKIASTAQGSVVAFDYFTTEALEVAGPYWRYGRPPQRPLARR